MSTGTASGMRGLVSRVKQQVGQKLTRSTERTTDPGVPPAPFNPEYYKFKYPDLAELDETQLLEHWNTYGQNENRLGWPQTETVTDQINQAAQCLDPSKETVLLVLHEGSYTGAPILGWNIARALNAEKNVVTLLLKGGEMTPAFDEVSTFVINGAGAEWNNFTAEPIAQALQELLKPAYAIANSAVTFPIVPSIGRSGIPTIALVHEFATGLRNGTETLLDDFYDQVSHVVFPAEIVAGTMRADYPILQTKPVLIYPQGQSDIPPKPALDEVRDDDDASDDDGSADEVEPPDSRYLALDEFLGQVGSDCHLVLAAGTIEPRKGTDLFIQTAAHYHRRHAGSNVKFAWIGAEGYDYGYNQQVKEQLRRYGDTAPVDFILPTDRLGELYQRTDVFFLPSRLDPMPNVAIDAAMLGIPVIAFDQGSGFAQWLVSSEPLQQLVVPDSDIAAAAELAGHLVDDAQYREYLSTQIAQHAQESFNMDAYVAKIDNLAHQI